MNSTAAHPYAPARSPARAAARKVALALAVGALALAGSAAQAQRHGWHHGGGYHGGDHDYRGRGWGAGPFWGGVGLGIGFGLAGAYSYYDDRPGYWVIDQAPVYVGPPLVPVPVYPSSLPPPAPAPAPVADPIFYPRDGQSAAQTEADRQACNRWATTQPKAMADASVFQRATLACMDGRGYTSR